MWESASLQVLQMRGHARERTAERVALRRAAHQLLDRPLVFEDPLALAMVGPEEAVRSAAEREASRPRSRFLRAFMAARSRFAEDELGGAINARYFAGRADGLCVAASLARLMSARG